MQEVGDAIDIRTHRKRVPGNRIRSAHSASASKWRYALQASSSKAVYPCTMAEMLTTKRIVAERLVPPQTCPKSKPEDLYPSLMVLRLLQRKDDFIPTSQTGDRVHNMAEALRSTGGIAGRKLTALAQTQRSDHAVSGALVKFLGSECCFPTNSLPPTTVWCHQLAQLDTGISSPAAFRTSGDTRGS
jgi:hypothetical protein